MHHAGVQCACVNPLDLKLAHRQKRALRSTSGSPHFWSSTLVGRHAFAFKRRVAGCASQNEAESTSVRRSGKLVE
jgi:hypothetical protein